MAEAVAKRSEIPVKMQWAVEDLFENREAWEAERQAVSELIGKAESYRGHLGDSAQMLCEYLDYETELTVRLQRVGMYASLNMDVDTTDMAGQAMDMKAQMQD